MDELVERLMSLTPIVSQVIKRTGLSMEQLDQMVRITPCVVVDDDGDEMITFLASTTMCSKPGFMAEAYEFGIARLHFECCINSEKAEKKIRLALEGEFQLLESRAASEAVCDTNNTLANENDALQAEIEENAPFTDIGRKVSNNKGSEANKKAAKDRREKIIEAWLEHYPPVWITGERCKSGSHKKIARLMRCSIPTVKRALAGEKTKLAQV
ncbi:MULTISPECIES: hypothetical protein [Enterobacteriaceae]|uniref:hypothetical protein n=1 Tax=Enterobacteriaceae TaxID=543 RepID=UPI0013D0D1F6|nr:MULTISPECIES: hypothetical protein [Enterobacteriaceae]MCD9415446.1 hypothetical protein [Klebsiella pneumoniae]